MMSIDLKHGIALAMAAMVASASMAASEQSHQGRGSSNPQQLFDEFNKRAKSDYDAFAQKVLSKYDQFLEAAWEEYEVCAPLERNSAPKPATMPTVADIDTIDSSIDVGSIPPPPALAADEEEGEAAEAGEFEFLFYGFPVNVPSYEVKLYPKLVNTADYAYQWRQLTKNPVTTELISALREKAREMKLNDYLTYIMVRDYVVAKYPEAHDSSHMSMVHYIMANMGYNARIGLAGDDPVIMLASKQKIYGRCFLEFDGVRFYLFLKDENSRDHHGKPVATCQLPPEANMSKKFDMVIRDLKIPYKAREFDVAFGDIEISGEVNANLEPILFRYPQMDIEGYAQSVISPQMRQAVVAQVKSSIEGLEEKDAVNKILRFVQRGFRYATDELTHGFEKPYFFEEMFFYDTCDCEDRAIFYSYLVWNALGVRNHIINYPGHESVAVSLLEDIEGTNYDYGGKKFYISDPTFQGSVTGQCMPDYSSLNPTIDYRYE